MLRQSCEHRALDEIVCIPSSQSPTDATKKHHSRALQNFLDFIKLNTSPKVWIERVPSIEENALKNEKRVTHAENPGHTVLPLQLTLLHVSHNVWLKPHWTIMFSSPASHCQADKPSTNLLVVNHEKNIVTRPIIGLTIVFNLYFVRIKRKILSSELHQLCYWHIISLLNDLEVCDFIDWDWFREVSEFWSWCSLALITVSFKVGSYVQCCLQLQLHWSCKQPWS